MNGTLWYKQPTIKPHKDLVFCVFGVEAVTPVCTWQTRPCLLQLCVFPGQFAAAQVKRGQKNKKATTGRAARNLLNASDFHPVRLCEYQPDSGTQKQPASARFSWRSWKVISHQGMTQTGTSILYPGWVNVGMLSSAAEGWLGPDPSKINKDHRPSIWPVLWVLRVVMKLSCECCWFDVIYLPVLAPKKDQ